MADPFRDAVPPSVQALGTSEAYIACLPAHVGGIVARAAVAPVKTAKLVTLDGLIQPICMMQTTRGRISVHFTRLIQIGRKHELRAAKCR